VTYDPRDLGQRAELVAALDAARERLQAVARPVVAGQGVQLRLGQEGTL
jgi:hypothetical protein